MNFYQIFFYAIMIYFILSVTYMFGFINGKEYQMKIDIQRFNQIMTELNQKIKSSYEELRKILKK